MKRFQLPNEIPISRFVVFFVLLAGVLIAAEVTGHLVQTGSGRMDVSNVTYPNANGVIVRAKLFRPNGDPGPRAELQIASASRSSASS